MAEKRIEGVERVSSVIDFLYFFVLPVCFGEVKIGK